jgi:hypothetical protein
MLLLEGPEDRFEGTSEFIPQRGLPWGAQPKQTFFPGKRKKKSTFSHGNPLTLSYNPLDMNIPFKIDLELSKS